ncbi:hypothetical protein [Lysobacter sp. CA199]|uniref:hypothetical protein n=1 Tax=Lysobacter sp. CA199 TaxID=3455608 RepID=UPI003F8D46FF
MNTQAPSNSSPMPWPLTFDSFSFGSRVYNTLRCSILFNNYQFALDDELDVPSGEPRSADWKDHWTASHNVFFDDAAPGSVEVRWMPLDGVERTAEIDLIEEVVPNRIVHHNVSKAEVNEDWARFDKVHPELLMEVNDRVITIYMKARILTNSSRDPERPNLRSRNELVQVWSKTY